MPGIFKSRSGSGSAPTGHYYVTYGESSGSPTPYGIMKPEVVTLYRKKSSQSEEYVASYCGSGLGTTEQKESDFKGFAQKVNECARNYEVHFSDEAVNYVNTEASYFGFPTI